MLPGSGMAERQFKLVLLGNMNVGKTSMALRFVRNQFFEYQDNTIGAAFLTKSLVMDDATLKFEIWDTAGQERFASLAPMYYRGAAAAIVVYDITSEESLQVAKKWVAELRQKGSAGMVIALAGNKLDMEVKRAVQKAEVEAYAAEQGILFFEISAKADIGVQQVFLGVAAALPKEDPETKKGLDLNSKLQPEPSAGCC